MTDIAKRLADAPPGGEHVTDYDRAHFKTYARLLDAAADNAERREVADLVLGLDVVAQPDHARRVHDVHLECARWMTRQGHKDLLSGAATR
jgi:hypothetical protein